MRVCVDLTLLSIIGRKEKHKYIGHLETIEAIQLNSITTYYYIFLLNGFVCLQSDNENKNKLNCFILSLTKKNMKQKERLVLNYILCQLSFQIKNCLLYILLNSNLLFFR